MLSPFAPHRDQHQLRASLTRMPAFLTEIFAAIHQRTPAAEIHQRLLRYAIELAQIPAENAILRFIADEKTGKTRNVVTINDLYTANIIDDLRGITGRAIRTHTPQIIDNVAHDPDYVVLGPNVRSEIASPMLIGDRCIGVLNVESRHEAWFNAADLQWVSPIAGLAALAEDIEALRASYEISALTGIDAQGLALKKSLTGALEEIITLFTPTRGIMAEVMGVVPNNKQLLTLALSPIESVAIHIRLREGEGTTGTVFQTGIARVGDISPAGGDITHLLSTKSVLVLPLIGPDQQRLGVLNIEADHPGAFTKDDVDRLRAAGLLARIERLLLPLVNSFATNEQVVESLLNDAEAQIFAIIDPDNLAGTYHQFLQIAAQITEEPNVSGGILLVRPSALRNADVAGIAPPKLLTLTATLGNYKPARDEWFVSGQSVTRTVYHTQKTKLIEHADTDSDWRPVGPGFERGAEICVPLKAHGKVIGVIDLVSPVAKAFTSNDGSNLERLARLIEHAIERAEEIRRARTAERRLRFTLDLQARLNPLYGVDPVDIDAISEQVITIILEEAMQATSAEVGQVLLTVATPKHGTQLFVRATAGAQLPEARDRWHDTTGITGRALRDRQPQVVPDVTQDRAYLSSFPGILSEMALPVQRGEQVIGVLDLEARHRDHFTTRHQQSGEFFSALLAQTLSTLELARETRRDLLLANHSDVMDQEIAKFHTMSLESDARSPGILAHRNRLLLDTLRLVVTMTGADAGSVMLSVNAYHQDGGRDDENGRLFEVSSWPPESKPLNPEDLLFSINRGVSGTVLRSGAYVVFNDIDQRPNEYFGDANTLAELAVPLFEGPKIVGVLNLESHTAGCFTPDRIETARDAVWILSDIIVSAKVRINEVQKVQLRTFEIDMLRNLALDYDALAERVLSAATTLTTLHDGHALFILARRYPGDPPDTPRQVVSYYATVDPTGQIAPPRRSRIEGLRFDHDHPVIPPGIIAESLNTRESLLIPSLTSSLVKTNHTHNLPWPEIGSLLCVPLLRPAGADREAFGVILLAARERVQFSDTDDEALTLFAQAVTISMRNIDLLNAREDLSRDMKHDFNTTVRPLIDTLKLITPQVLAAADERLRDEFARIQQLALMTNDIIYWFADLSKEQVDLDGEPTYPEPVTQIIAPLRDRMDLFAQLKTGHHVLWTDIPENVMIRGGETRDNLLRAALFKLIENAVKFGQYDDVRVIIRVLSDHVEFVIRNRGPQVDERERQLIFELGFRGLSSAKATTGSGIGLYQVQKIAILLHGSVNYHAVESDQNDFTLTLPIEPGITQRKERNDDHDPRLGG